MAFTLLFEWFRNTFVSIKSFKVNNLLIRIDDSHFFFQTWWNWNCFSGRKRKVWGDKGETICPFRKPDKPLQVYIVCDPSICFSNHALSCIPTPVYFFLLLLLLLSLPATTQELPIGPNCSQCMIQDSFCGLYPRWLFVSTVFIPEPILL